MKAPKPGGLARVPGFSSYEVSADGATVWSRASRSVLGFNTRGAGGPRIEPPEVYAYEDGTGRMRRVAAAELAGLAHPRPPGKGEEGEADGKDEERAGAAEVGVGDGEVAVGIPLAGGPEDEGMGEQGADLR